MAATVFDTIINADTSAFTGSVTFRMVPAPRFRVQDTASAGDITVDASAAGFISTELVGGEYWCFIGQSRPFIIKVPADENSYHLHDLRVDLYGDGTFSPVPTDENEIGYNYKETDGVLQLINTTTGRWHAVWISETPDPATPTIGAEQDPGDTVLHRIDGTSFQFKNADTGNWHSIYITGTDGSYTLNVSDHTTPLSANYRYEDQRLQFYNTDSGLWHTLYISGSGVSIQFSIPDGEA